MCMADKDNSHEDDLSFELKECTHGAIAPTNHTGARFQLYNEPNDGSGDGSSHRRSHGHGHGRHGDRRGRDGRQRDRKAHNQSRGSEARSARN